MADLTSDRTTPDTTGDRIRLLLLRHAKVDGHRGDVPITENGVEQARAAGRWVAARGQRVGAVLFGGTLRTRQTAEQILEGIRSVDGSEGPVSVDDAFALRNPDLYLAGHRVTMVSTAEAFADQVPGLAPEVVRQVPFYEAWLTHPERVGFWVAHTSPPGETADLVNTRMEAFASSMSDAPAWRGTTVVAVTHSPVLRSVGVALRGVDPGEPTYVHGYEMLVSDGRLTSVTEAGPQLEPPAATTGETP